MCITHFHRHFIFFVLCCKFFIIIAEKAIFLHVAEMIPKLKSRIQKQNQQQQQAAQQAKQNTNTSNKGKGKKKR